MMHVYPGTKHPGWEHKNQIQSRILKEGEDLIHHRLHSTVLSPPDPIQVWHRLHWIVCKADQIQVWGCCAALSSLHYEQHEYEYDNSMYKLFYFLGVLSILCYYWVANLYISIGIFRSTEPLRGLFFKYADKSWILFFRYPDIRMNANIKWENKAVYQFYFFI